MQSKHFYLWTSLAIIFLFSIILVACNLSDNKNDLEMLPQVVEFPAKSNEKNDYNVFVFENNFTISVTMPEGATIDTAKSLSTEGMIGVFSCIPIINPQGNEVGRVGYNVYDAEQLETLQDDREKAMVIYNQISLGNHYHFTIRDSYETITDTTTWSSALTYIYNDMNCDETTEYSESDYNYGIVSYSKVEPVYIAFDLDKKSFTLEQIKAIAQSISFDFR